MREVIPAQRKLAKLVRPDSNVLTAQVIKEKKEYLRQTTQKQRDVEDQERKFNVEGQKKKEKQAILLRKQTERARYLRSCRRPFSAKELERAAAPPPEKELTNTEILIRDVRRRKRRSQSARKKRAESQKHAMSFMNANNATSKHIAKGNSIRRKRQQTNEIKRRVARARYTTMEKQTIMHEAAVRRDQQQLAKIHAAKEEYTQMLAWRKNLDVQKLEMARLRKEYNKDLSRLVQKIQRGELDQPIWNVDQPPREIVKRQLDAQYIVPTRPISRGTSGSRGENGYGAYNGNFGVSGSRPSSREETKDGSGADDMPLTTYSTGPTMSRTIDLKQYP